MWDWDLVWLILIRNPWFVKSKLDHRSKSKPQSGMNHRTTKGRNKATAGKCIFKKNEEAVHLEQTKTHTLSFIAKISWRVSVQIQTLQLPLGPARPCWSRQFSQCLEVQRYKDSQASPHRHASWGTDVGCWSLFPLHAAGLEQLCAEDSWPAGNRCLQKMKRQSFKHKSTYTNCTTFFNQTQ